MSWTSICLALTLHTVAPATTAPPLRQHSGQQSTTNPSPQRQNEVMPWQIYFAGGLLPDLSGLALKIGVYQKLKRKYEEHYWRWGVGVFGSRYLKSEIYITRAWSALFKMRLQYETWLWPGIFEGRGVGLRFDSPNDNFDSATLRARSGEEEFQIGHALRLRPTWMYETKKWAFVNELNLRTWFIPGQKSYWYDVSYHTLIRRGDLDLTLNNTPWVFHKVWQGDTGQERLWLGVLHQFTWAMRSNIVRHRLGAAFIFRPFETIGPFPGLTLFGIGGINIVERHRKGKLWGAMLILREFEF